ADGGRGRRRRGDHGLDLQRRLRGPEQPPRRARAAPRALADLAGRGDADVRPRRGVDAHRLLHGHLPGGAAGRAARARGGHDGGRRWPVDPVPEADLAAAAPHHVRPARGERGVLAAGLRHRLRAHRRRSRLRHDGADPVHLPDRVHERGDGLRERDRGRVRADPARVHRPAVAGEPTRGGGGMTSLVHDTRPALEAPAAAPAARRSRMTPGRWVVWALLVGGALVMAFPVYWILVTALTPGGQSRSGEFYLWPSEPTLANFAEAFASQPVGRWIVNSIVIAGIGTAITVIVALMAGYAFAKFSFRGRGVLFGAFLVTIVVPAQVTLVPSFLVVVDLHLVDTIWAVILPRAGDAIAVFIARQFMLKIPDAL